MLAILTLLVVSITLLSGAINIIALCLPLYYAFAYGLHLPAAVNLSFGQMLANYHAVWRYVLFPWEKHLVMPNFPSSAQGLFHFAEVKTLFHGNQLFFLLGLLLSYYLLKKSRQQGLSWQLSRYFKGLIPLSLALIFALLLFFAPIFTAFHELVFRNDAWLFRLDQDPVIQILPESYFMACFIGVFIVFILGLWLLSYQLKRS